MFQHHIPNRGSIDPRFDNTGHVVRGHVTSVNPPNVIESIWNSPNAEDTFVSWDLHLTEVGCLLILTHTFKVPDEFPKMMAGWHVHFEMLTQTLLGERVQWPWNRWEELRDHYSETLRWG
jgi:hypothetical protein